MPYSPLQRPTLSPISFGKEMTRLKNENYSIKDDIARFRNTLQVRNKKRERTNLYSMFNFFCAERTFLFFIYYV